MTTAGKNILIIDFETFYDTDNKYDLKSISVAEYIRDDRFKAHCMGFNMNGVAGMASGEKEITDVLNGVDWENTVLVAHNVKFDGTIVAWIYGHRPAMYVDTVSIAKAVVGQNLGSFSLYAVGQYLDLPQKGDLAKIDVNGSRDLDAKQVAELQEYCANDVAICKGIYDKLRSQFPASQYEHMDWTVRCFTSPKLVLDLDKLAKGVEDEKLRRDTIISATGIDRTVFSSNKKFAELLASNGIKVPTKVSASTGKTIPAFAKTDPGLAGLEKSHPQWYAARIASKSSLLETRGEALHAVGKTGPFPFDVGFSGAIGTHRYSGGSGAGGNPQNFTRGSFLRGAVSAPEGHSMVVGDFAQIELRLLAWLAKEPKLMNSIMANLDTYSEFASSFYGRVITKKDLIERMFGKTSILGLGYNMGAEKFLTTVNLMKLGDDATPEQVAALKAFKAGFTYEKAQDAVFLYRETYFNVPKLWGFAQRLIPLIAKGEIGCLFFAPFIRVEKETLILPSGLRIQYPNLRYEDREWVYDDVKEIALAERMQRPPNLPRLYGGKLIENICQALAGELCKESIARAEKGGLDCVGQVHDEVIGLIKTTYQKTGAYILQQAMEVPPRWMPTIRLKAEVGYGPNWLESKV